MKLAVIGAGRLGTALGEHYAGRGHEVVYGGGDEASNTEAARAADVVILSVPFGAVGPDLDQCGPLEGKLLWSCVNALKPDFSGLAVGFDNSGAEEVAKAAGGARVVAGLPPFADQIAAGDLRFGDHVPAVFLCSDDEGAKEVVADLVRELGADPVDAGPLTAARLVEPAMMLMVGLAYGTDPPRTLGLRVMERG